MELAKLKTVTRELTTWSLRILALFSSSKLREHKVQRSGVTITGVPNIGAAPCAREIKQNYKDFSIHNLIKTQLIKTGLWFSCFLFALEH